MNIISVRQKPEWVERFIAYFQEKWSSEESRAVYRDSIIQSMKSSSPLPEWYLLMDGERVAGCAGLITNDFISRMDLYPWLCALYVEEAYRGQALGAQLISRARADAAMKGYTHLYICTDHVGYYEKYGFRFLGMGYHPWGETSRIYVSDTGACSARICLYAGSFDPPTVGHVDVIRRACKLFDRVVVAVMIHPEKKGLFAPEERVALLKKCLSGTENVTVLQDSGLTVDVARRAGAGVLLRGVRGESDVGWETQLSSANRHISGLETLILFTDPRYGYISSSVVRDVLKHSGPIEGMVPDAILADVLARKPL